MNAECFTANKWNAPKLCACGEARRPGQFDCYRCHALAAAVYRARKVERARRKHASDVKALATRHAVLVP